MGQRNVPNKYESVQFWKKKREKSIHGREQGEWNDVIKIYAVYLDNFKY